MVARKRKAARRSGKEAEPKTPEALESTGSEPPALSKSEFIRSRPPGMTAKQVVVAAAARGMKLSEHFVYNIRSSAKKRAAKVRRDARVSTGAARVGRGDGAQAAQFRSLVLDLGLARARALLDDMERRLSAVISGS